MFLRMTTLSFLMLWFSSTAQAQLCYYSIEDYCSYYSPEGCDDVCDTDGAWCGAEEHWNSDDVFYTISSPQTSGSRISSTYEVVCAEIHNCYCVYCGDDEDENPIYACLPPATGTEYIKPTSIDLNGSCP